MISEKNNILSGTLVYSPEFEQNAKKVVIKTANIMADSNGIVPLSKENAFEQAEVVEEVLDFDGPSSVGPIPAPVHSDIITDAPVLTENPSELESARPPLESLDIVNKGRDVFNNAINRVEGLSSKPEEKLISPLGVEMPEIETPLETEPNGINDALFAGAPQPVSPQGLPAMDVVNQGVQLPESPQISELPQVPNLQEIPEVSEVPEESQSSSPSLEEMLSPSGNITSNINVAPKLSGTEIDKLEDSIADRAAQFENDFKISFEDQIDAFRADVNDLIRTYIAKSDNLDNGSMSESRAPELPQLPVTPEPTQVSSMQQPQQMIPSVQPQMMSPMQSQMMSPMQTPMQPQMVSQQQVPQFVNNQMGGNIPNFPGAPMGNSTPPQFMGDPSQNPSPFSAQVQPGNFIPQYENPEPEKVDEGPIKGGGMFIQF